MYGHFEQNWLHYWSWVPVNWYQILPPSGRRPPDVKNFVKPILDSLFNQKFICGKQHKFLLSSTDSDRKRVFYSVPKIYKSLSTWPSKTCPPSRPIISDVDSPTYQISKYISDQIQKLSTSHESYLKDNYDFLNQLRLLKFDKDIALVTLDVKSLYTNIDTPTA